jgi:hypothetical protein
LEAAASLLLLAVGMIAGLEMIRVSRQGVQSGYLTTRAVTMAEALMEEKLSIPYRALSAAAGEGTDAVEGFRRFWTVKPDGTGGRFIVIRVRVEWNDPAGRPHGLGLAALRAEGTVP